MGYEYIQTTKIPAVPEEKVMLEVGKLMELRLVEEITIKHSGCWMYDITCKNKEFVAT